MVMLIGLQNFGGTKMFPFSPRAEILRKSPGQVFEVLSLAVNEERPVLSGACCDGDTGNFFGKTYLVICFFSESVL